MFTDHKNLSWVNESRVNKVRRWALRLQEYCPHVFWIAGKDNVIADWLLRSTPPSQDELDERMLVPLTTLVASNKEEAVRLPTPRELADAARKELPTLNFGLEWKDDMPYERRSRRLYVAAKWRPTFLYWFHASRFAGHHDANKTTRMLRRYVWWPKLHDDVAAYVKCCIVCRMLRPLSTPVGTAERRPPLPVRSGVARCGRSAQARRWQRVAHPRRNRPLLALDGRDRAEYAADERRHRPVSTQYLGRALWRAANPPVRSQKHLR